MDINPDDFVARPVTRPGREVVNIASRAAGFVHRLFDGRLVAAAASPSSGAPDELRRAAVEIAALYEAREPRQGRAQGDGLADFVNGYWDSAKPWLLAKSDAAADRVALARRLQPRRSRCFRLLTLYLKPDPARSSPAVPRRSCARRRSPGTTSEAPLGGGHAIAPLPAPDAARRRQAARRAVRATGEPAPVAGASDAIGRTAARRPRRLPRRISIDEFTKVDLRIAADHRLPSKSRGSTKLLKLTLDVGEARHRTVFAGIERPTRPSHLVGRLTVMRRQPGAAQDEVRPHRKAWCSRRSTRRRQGASRAVRARAPCRRRAVDCACAEMADANVTAVREYGDMSWHDGPTRGVEDVVEGGAVLAFPQLAFALDAAEQRFLDPRWADPKAKNVSVRWPSGELRGAAGTADDLQQLRALIVRFAEQSEAFALRLFPHYRGHLRCGNTSFA